MITDQVRSECLTCTFIAHACHGHRYRPSSIPWSGTGKKRGKGGGGTACTGGYKGIRAVRPELVAGGGCFEFYGI